jgi:hypothetical protein
MNLREILNVFEVLVAVAIKITTFWILRKKHDVSQENITSIFRFEE